LQTTHIRGRVKRGGPYTKKQKEGVTNHIQERGTLSPTVKRRGPYTKKQKESVTNDTQERDRTGTRTHDLVGKKTEGRWHEPYTGMWHVVDHRKARRPLHTKKDGVTNHIQERGTLSPTVKRGGPYTKIQQEGVTNRPHKSGRTGRRTHDLGLTRG